RYEPGAFAPLRDTLLTHGDHYMHLADLTSYTRAQDALGELYADGGEWARKAILNVASSGKFSSDRTISEYATQIWKAKPCPIPYNHSRRSLLVSRPFRRSPVSLRRRKCSLMWLAWRDSTSSASPTSATATNSLPSAPADTAALRCTALSPSRTSWRSPRRS